MQKVQVPSIKAGTKVDIVGARYRQHNYSLVQCTVMNENNDGTFDVRTYSDINGFIVLKTIQRSDLEIADLW